MVMTDFLRVDARMALARYESSVAAFGMEAGFPMKDVYAVKEYIERLETMLLKSADRIEKLEASETEWQPICDSYAAENQRFSDRIEKLEAALREIRQSTTLYGAQTKARKALEGKDD
jgi:chromosome segregation ATPase